MDLPSLLPLVLLVSAPLALADRARAQSASAEELPRWEEGRPLPALRLPTVDGRGTVDLRRLQGKRLLLIEFASW